MATFAKFLIKHKDTELCKQFIFAEMEDFVENYIKQFDNYTEVPVHFVGSIGFVFKDILEEVANDFGLKLGLIIKNPVELLVKFHIESYSENLI